MSDSSRFSAGRTGLRIVNGLRKVAHGLRPFGESVWPGVRNDLFVAHESIYHFFSRWASGNRILDAGCGAGYGSSILLKAGASSITGIDLDPLNIRYARRSFANDKIAFRTMDMEKLDFEPASFDLITSSNSMEHLNNPDSFLARCRNVLAQNGRLLVGVPPIYSESDHEVHHGIHYHRSNLPVDEWYERLAKEFEVECFLHRAIGSRQPDFSSPTRSGLAVADFEFTQIPLAILLHEPSITAVFVCSAP